MQDKEQEKYEFYRDPFYFLRDARSSPFIRLVDGQPQRYNPSPELDRYEEIYGTQKTFTGGMPVITQGT